DFFTTSSVPVSAGFSKGRKKRDIFQTGGSGPSSLVPRSAWVSPRFASVLGWFFELISNSGR
ncbi:MAG: hypothetical protein QGD90_09715, partial [Candidatus Hydrogenedentes bacterium]|nr:hypothetical protein [Candidatus Hydrogenedentota bacterium]